MFFPLSPFFSLNFPYFFLLDYLRHLLSVEKSWRSQHFSVSEEILGFSVFKAAAISCSLIFPSRLASLECHTPPKSNLQIPCQLQKVWMLTMWKMNRNALSELNQCLRELDQKLIYCNSDWSVMNHDQSTLKQSIQMHPISIQSASCTNAPSRA